MKHAKRKRKIKAPLPPPVRKTDKPFSYECGESSMDITVGDFIYTFRNLPPNTRFSVGIDPSGLPVLTHNKTGVTHLFAAVRPAVKTFDDCAARIASDILNRAILKEEKEILAGKTDNVNHPSHYGGADNVYEVIKVIMAWGLGFNLGSAVKYIGRAGKKDAAKHIEDLEKAVFYINYEIGQLKERRNA